MQTLFIAEALLIWFKQLNPILTVSLFLEPEVEFENEPYPIAIEFIVVIFAGYAHEGDTGYSAFVAKD
jgi:hypothetical protein